MRVRSLHPGIDQLYSLTVNNTLLFSDVDTRKEFLLPDGALHMPGSTEILPALARVTSLAREAIRKLQEGRAT